MSENGSGKLHSLVLNRVTIWRNGRHTPIIACVQTGYPIKNPRSTPREYQPSKTQVLCKNLWKKITVCYCRRLSQLERAARLGPVPEHERPINANPGLQFCSTFCIYLPMHCLK